jgi:hypothetical protein
MITLALLVITTKMIISIQGIKIEIPVGNKIIIFVV